MMNREIKKDDILYGCEVSFGCPDRRMFKVRVTSAKTEGITTIVTFEMIEGSCSAPEQVVGYHTGTTLVGDEILLTSEPDELEHLNKYLEYSDLGRRVCNARELLIELFKGNNQKL